MSMPRYALVDPEDYERFKGYEWSVKSNNRSHYTFRFGPKGHNDFIFMHREIIKAGEGKVVDHINHNGMDNRRANIRPATYTQNMCNRIKFSNSSSSKYKGVYFKKWNNKWVARIGIDGKSLWLGYFEDEVEAAKAYDRAAKKYFGEFACLNFPE